MRIGIDMDDTITNSWECLLPYYSRMFNIPEDVLRKSKPYYNSVAHLITLEEYFEMMTPIYDSVIPNVTLKDNVKATIDALYELGHQVFFITARGRGHTDPYKDTKDYLDRYHIKYEKIITNAENKAKACKEEHIDLFIDDSPRHAKEVSELGIKVLMPETYYNKDVEFTHFNNWGEVLDLIKER